MVEAFRAAEATAATPLRFRVVQSNLPNKHDVLQRLQSCDTGKMVSWVDNALALPIGKYAPPPVKSVADMPMFVRSMRDAMDAEVFGQHQAKDEVMRLMCQWVSSGCLSTFAIGLEGPPGIGKTTFAQKVIAKAMHRPFQFIGLGGASDACSLIGHSFTYEGAMPGKIAESLRAAKVMNPVFFFDELDKVSKTPKGDEVTNVLVHLTDLEQNTHMADRYFHGIPLDLSNALLVFSYNDPREISPVLLDRLNVIRIAPPTASDKAEIASRHLLPRALSSAGLGHGDAVVSPAVLAHIIASHTAEAGVRGLAKALERVVGTLGVFMHIPDGMRSLALEIPDVGSRPLACTRDMVDVILAGSRPAGNQRIATMYT